MTDISYDAEFEQHRRAVLDSHLQLALTENAELEAIIEAVDAKTDELHRRGAISSAASTALHTIVSDTGNTHLKRREHEARREAFREAAEAVVHIVDVELARADNDHADAARHAYESALREAHSRLLVLAERERGADA